MTRPFTAADFTERMTRAAAQASAAGLSGVLVTPGADLLYALGWVLWTDAVVVMVVQVYPEPKGVSTSGPSMCTRRR